MFPVSSTAETLNLFSPGSNVKLPFSSSETGCPFTVTVTAFSSVTVTVCASQYVFPSSIPSITGGSVSAGFVGFTVTFTDAVIVL